MTIRKLTVAATVAAFFSVPGGSLQAQVDTSVDQVLTLTPNASFRSFGKANARPHTNRLTPPDTSLAHAQSDDGRYVPGFMSTRGPIVVDVNANRRAFGSFGIPYTTTRVQEGPRSVAATNSNRLSTSYPYRTVGKLTFRRSDGRASFCTATVIRRGIIVTAAHCIQRLGSGSVLNTNFGFRPGHYGAPRSTPAQTAPYGAWGAVAIMRPASWATGTDLGTGAARENDVALLAMERRDGRFIGDVVGKLNYGWNNYSFVSSPKTGNLHTAAITTLGYPGLLDVGRVMQRTDGPTYTTIIGDVPQLWQGSNFTGGSSGGPWIVNFTGRNALRTGGALPGDASVMAVVGVTSWGSSDPNAPKDNYSSRFSQNTRYPNADYGGYGAGNIGSLMNTLCTATAPGGGTFASQGYCN